MMTEERAHRIIAATEKREKARKSNRKRGPQPDFREAVAFLKGMPEVQYCEWCLSTVSVELHHIIDHRHNLLHQLMFLCRTPCHLLAHDGHFQRPSNQELCMTKHHWDPRDVQKIAKLAGPKGKRNWAAAFKFARTKNPDLKDKSIQTLVYDLQNGPKKKSAKASVTAEKVIPASVIFDAVTAGWLIDWDA